MAPSLVRIIAAVKLRQQCRVGMEAHLDSASVLRWRPGLIDDCPVAS